jgi:hypothetical protein
VTEGISLRNNNSSVFSTAAKNSLEESFGREYSHNPYFPHNYSHGHDQSHGKLTGRRNWDYKSVEKYQLPSVEEQYFPKWS